MARGNFPPVYCKCGCGKLAANHPHPFGVTQEHIRWCRHLKEIGQLDEKHRTCARLPLITIDDDGCAWIDVPMIGSDVPAETAAIG